MAADVDKCSGNETERIQPANSSQIEKPDEVASTVTDLRNKISARRMDDRWTSSEQETSLRSETTRASVGEDERRRETSAGRRHRDYCKLEDRSLLPAEDRCRRSRTTRDVQRRAKSERDLYRCDVEKDDRRRGVDSSRSNDPTIDQVKSSGSSESRSRQHEFAGSVVDADSGSSQNVGVRTVDGVGYQMVLTRHVNQLFLRGDNVIFVAIASS